MSLDAYLFFKRDYIAIKLSSQFFVIILLDCLCISLQNKLIKIRKLMTLVLGQLSEEKNKVLV